MPTSVLMPKLSDTMEEGKILRWLKQKGDTVAIGDVLAEVETDKANMELEAFDEGVLAEIKTPEGESAPVGAVIAVLRDAGEVASASDDEEAAPKQGEEKQSAAKPAAKAKPVAKAKPAAESGADDTDEASRGEDDAAAAEQGETGASEGQTAASEEEPPPDADEHADERASAAPKGAPPPESRSAPRAVPRPAPAKTRSAEDPDDRVRASPLARRLAQEKGIDLHGITGTGPGGRIVERDLEQATAASADTAAPEKAPAAKAPAEKPRATATGDTPPAAREPAATPGTRVEPSKIRRTTARRMAESKRDVPHFYVSGDVAMDDAVRLREALVALGGEYADLTLTPLVVKAVGLALRRVPELNASLDGDAVLLHADVNVGIATAVDDGLVVPVARNCDREPLATLGRTIGGLVDRARRGRFGANDLSGGTFTVSNLGMYPVSSFAAVINPPQAAILAVGTVREVPVVRNGEVVPGRLMTVTLSCDHRVVDGVLAARFLREVKSLLENPLALVV